MSDSGAPGGGLRVFVSYSHRDRRYLERLVRHLSLLVREGVLAVWHDANTDPGQNIAGEIGVQLESADIVLLLVSADYIFSDFCFKQELRRALQRHAQGVTRVIPVILKPVDWRSAPFGGLKALPQEGKPINQWRSLDDGFSDVATSLRAVANELAAREST